MDAENFVKRLWDCRPSLSSLTAQGLSTEEAQTALACYEAHPKACQHIEADPVVALVANYNATGISIGMVSLLEKPLDQECRIAVGKVDADDLVVDKDSGEIRVEELGTSRHVLWRCARDGSHFLDALLPCAAFLERCTLESVGNAARSQAAVSAALSAGGEDFRRFYEMLLGCDD